MLRVLFFDLDDTLYSSTQFAWQAREQAVDAMIRHGLREEKERVLEELREVVEEFSSNDDHHFDRLLERLPARATRGCNRLMLVMAGVIAYHETKWRELRVQPTVRALLEDLVAAEIRLGVLTSGLAGKQMEKILRLGLQPFVDPALILITDQEGIAKSNPKFYRRAVRRAGVRPEEALHVGDHPLHDVESARRAGLWAVQHRGSGKYAQLEPALPPHQVIEDLGQLRGVLAEHYGVVLPA